MNCRLLHKSETVTLLVTISLVGVKRGEVLVRGKDQSEEFSHVTKNQGETLVVRESRRLRPAAKKLQIDWAGFY